MLSAPRQADGAGLNRVSPVVRNVVKSVDGTKVLGLLFVNIVPILVHAVTVVQRV
jgi:hypothetical protein